MPSMTSSQVMEGMSEHYNAYILRYIAPKLTVRDYENTKRRW